MNPKYKHVLAFFYGSPWAIMPAKLAEIQAVLSRRVAGQPDAEFVHVNKPEPKAFQDTPGGAPQDAGPGYTIYGGVAVIPISGTITPRPSLFEEWSGGTSHDAIGKATEAALRDGKVESIVYEVDSPGGVVFGMPETAAKVAAAGKSKPTIAVANHVAASAAYWYASQCAEIAVTPAGTVGCIGVLMSALDETKALEMAGIRAELVSNDTSPYKAEGWPQVATTAEHLADLKATCNAYAAMFEEAIAKGRGIRPATVARDFGKGRMLLAQDALAARMVDRIATLEDVVNGANGSKSRRARREVAAAMAARGLPIILTNPKNPT